MFAAIKYKIIIGIITWGLLSFIAALALMELAVTIYTGLWRNRVGSMDADVDTDKLATTTSDAASLSALQANIVKNGKTSYYYAHGHGANGPAWDGREEPRLLKRTESTESASKIFKREFESYAWADEKKSVKVYIDFPEAGDIDEGAYSLVTSTFTFS